MKASIIPMSESYRDKLEAYMHQIFPTYSTAFIKYDVNEAVGTNAKESKSVIAINEENEIVGCQIYFNTKAWIKGEVKDAFWGHNTYLNKEYRRHLGLDLIMSMVEIKNGFGYGLTDINFKIQHLVKTNIFIIGLRKFCIINRWYIWNKICKRLGKKYQEPSSFPNIIKNKDTIFHLCKDAKEIIIPNEGFWNKDICEIDFIRDEDYLNKRFFHNTVHKYYVYTNQNNDCYFTIRPILFQGISAIQVADFRYSAHDAKIAKSIFQALEKLCLRSHSGALLFTTSDRNIQEIYMKKKLCKSYPVPLVCYKKNVSTENAYVYVNAADSDDEFYK